MKILVVEDDHLLNQTLSYNLKLDGYEVIQAHNKKQAMCFLEQESFALIVLDINLPDGTGYELCTYIKENEKGMVIFLTAKDMEEEQLLGYELGADDYVTKPFSIRIFQKKVAAMLNQKKRQENYYKDACLMIDFDKRTAVLEDEPITFTKNEYKLLRVLIDHKGIVLTRNVLLEKLWDKDGNFVDEHTLTTLVSRLRSKINSESHPYIKTVYGMGYIWAGEEEWK